MSEFSYQDNVRRGVTGPDTATCLMASFDRISETAEISPQTYEDYENLRDAYVADCPKDNEANYIPHEVVDQHRALRVRYYKELGVETYRNVTYRRADTEPQLREYLGALASGGFRTVLYLDTGGLHAIGLLPVGEDFYETKSTWSPFYDEAASVSELFEWLDRAPRMRKRENAGKKTVKTENIVALPPERTR